MAVGHHVPGPWVDGLHRGAAPELGAYVASAFRRFGWIGLVDHLAPRWTYNHIQQAPRLPLDRNDMKSMQIMVVFNGKQYGEALRFAEHDLLPIGVENVGVLKDLKD